MSTLLRLILTAFFVLVVLGFSALHTDQVTLNLSPLYDAPSVPLFVPVLFFVFVGFVWGALINWLNTSPLRLKARLQAKEIKSLNKEISDLKNQGNTSQQKDKVSRGGFDLLPASSSKAAE